MLDNVFVANTEDWLLLFFECICVLEGKALDYIYWEYCGAICKVHGMLLFDMSYI